MFIVRCASTSNVFDEARNKSNQFNRVSHTGVVYIYGPNRLFVVALSTNIKINGLDAGGTGPGTFFRWELKPDRYSFAAFSQESSAVIQLDVKANQHYFIRQDERLGLN